jgi:hypothetical protein
MLWHQNAHYLGIHFQLTLGLRLHKVMPLRRSPSIRRRNW